MDPTVGMESSRKRLGRGWRISARIFTGINVLGFIYAVSMSEPLHAAAHALIQLLGMSVYLVWRFSTREVAQHIPLSDPASDLLARIQHSVDRIALDVERVGEAQRFQAKLLQQKTKEGDR